jgi:hypothetical protein
MVPLPQIHSLADASQSKTVGTQIRWAHRILNQGCQRKIIEEICEISPDIGVAIFSQALVVETVPAKGYIGNQLPNCRMTAKDQKASTEEPREVRPYTCVICLLS